MINLAILNNNYQIKWIDDTILNLRMPTERQYQTIQQFTTLNGGTEAIDLLYQLTNEILNNNNEGRQVKAEDLSIDLCLLVLQDYFMFYQEKLEKAVNFQATQQVKQAK